MNENIFELLFFLAVIVLSLFQSVSKIKKKGGQPPAKGFLTTIFEEIRKAQEAAEHPSGLPTEMNPEPFPREPLTPEYLSEYEEMNPAPGGQPAAELPFAKPDETPAAGRALKEKEIASARYVAQEFPAGLMNAFVWSEIIGPPISKRKRRRLVRG